MQSLYILSDKNKETKQLFIKSIKYVYMCFVCI